MNDTVRESLSALMDGESSELELRRILNADEQTVRTEWANLHRSQQLLKNESNDFMAWDISSRVMAEIADEDSPSRSGTGWKQAVSGLAIAASVAAVVVVGSLGSNMFGGSSTMVADNNAVSGRVYPAQVSAAVGGVAVSAQAQASPAGPLLNNDAEARKRFEAYLRKHTDRAAFNNGQGMVSYARVVSQESK
ncbi:Sigma factor AlgU negative regulatory protein [Zhongshania aliphaticivorans]|uniref:Sigma factor AlgU negative regulatory protein n=1 Tax=Zhongshania aliphaticivorans TaxID=1470434 RepID=A0A5S9NFJ1_9GAMM|nr:sigma-E factor negative regulatory protein [Zhongshania aliphaticivorans]CAA0087332.1 Sigma factor AlgU negative regulatory protein [Zhongshania aliphaticivorans]CAA0114565.1 Sigma factor AlgU negative regulatory protein [Zhongshania aliphaticivorans]